MIHLKKTNATDIDFIELVKKLDADLAITDGDEHAFYHQYNGINDIKYAMVAYLDSQPIGCGAIKEYNPQTMEVKRMYVLPDYRGNGYATQILIALENWTATLQYRKCILETGKKQPYAIRLYQRNGYEVIPNYGQYAGMENSVCFMKKVNNFSINN